MTLPHEVNVRWDGAAICMRPAKEGSGVIAGSYVRAILEFAGVKDVMAKSIGASNPPNLVKAAFKGLESLQKKEDILKMREAKND